MSLLFAEQCNFYKMASYDDIMASYDDMCAETIGSDGNKKSSFKFHMKYWEALEQKLF